MNQELAAMLRSRILTAGVLLVGFLADLFLASVGIFALVLVLIVGIASWEWSRLSGVKTDLLQSVYAVLVGLVCLVGLNLPHSDGFIRVLGLLSFLFWICALAALFLAPLRDKINQVQPLLLLIGGFVMLSTVISIQYLRTYAPDASAWLLLYAFSVIWVMDIGAYFSGRRFGRNKLSPLISPGKSWEGVYGGLAATMVLMLVVMLIGKLAEGSLLKLVIATALAAVFSVIGDLYESRLKRAAEMKDSSNLLPGHGGVLDRLDGVVAAMPLFVFIWAWL